MHEVSYGNATYHDTATYVRLDVLVLEIERVLPDVDANDRTVS